MKERNLPCPGYSMDPALGRACFYRNYRMMRQREWQYPSTTIPRTSSLVTRACAGLHPVPGVIPSHEIGSIAWGKRPADDPIPAVHRIVFLRPPRSFASLFLRNHRRPARTQFLSRRSFVGHTEVLRIFHQDPLRKENQKRAVPEMAGVVIEGWMERNGSVWEGGRMVHLRSVCLFDSRGRDLQVRGDGNPPFRRSSSPRVEGDDGKDETITHGPSLGNGLDHPDGIGSENKPHESEIPRIAESARRRMRPERNVTLPFSAVAFARRHDPRSVRRMDDARHSLC